MERPKHRRFILPGLALLAGSVLLLGRQWFFNANEPAPAPIAEVEQQPAGRQSDEVELPAVEAASVSAPATVSAAPVAATRGFRGRVIDAVTRRPVKEFEVRMIRMWRKAEVFGSDEPITRTFQVESGRFEWNDDSASTWRGAVLARGYQLFDLGELKLVAGQTSREVVIPLMHGYAVRGRVFERSTGAGIGGAWIRFSEPNAGNHDKWRADAKSEVDGSFVLDGVPGGDITLAVGADEHGTRELEIAVDDKTPEQQIALSSGGGIAGTVTTAAGTPLKARIILMGPQAGRMEETNDAGQFSFKHLAAGRYVIATTAAGGGARETVVLGEDERREGIVLAFAPGRSVRGIIAGVRAEHLQRTFVGLHGRGQSGQSYPYLQARPDERGAYAFSGVPPGPAQLSVHSEGRQLFKAIVVPADQDVAIDMVFPPGVRLSGRITQSGKPVQKTIWVQPAEFQRGPHYRATTSEDGQYEVEGVAPGEYRLMADEDFSRPVSIAADTVLNIDIPLVELGGSVLEDGSSVPIVGANVYVRGTEPATSRVRADRTTDDFGNFKLIGLEPGEVLLTVYRPGYELYREKIAYGTPITNRKVTLRRGSGVEVRAHSAAGKEQARGFTIIERIPNNEQGVQLWIPLDREGVGYVPSALAGSRLEFYGAGHKWVAIEEWDGQSFEVRL